MRKSFAVLAAALGLLFLAFEVNAGPLDSPGAIKSMVCSACHGSGGNSPGNTVPIIAGMSPAYFKKAIKDYAEGKRPSPEMEPFSKYVLETGLDETATYFAEQKKQPPRIKADPTGAKRGKAAAGQCIACHGQQGQGDAEKGWPAIQGQPAGYLQIQMVLFKEDKRKLEDAAQDDLKKKILKAMDDRHIADVAAYYSSLK